MKKASLSMGIKALIYVVIAVILIFGISNFGSQLFKSIFGSHSQCFETDYITDEIHELVDSIKANEVDYAVRLIHIKKGCSLVSFDADKDQAHGIDKPNECLGKTCLCVCSTDSFGLGRKPNCGEHTQCTVFEEEMAFRSKLPGRFVFGADNPIKIFTNFETPYYINYKAGIVYFSRDNLFSKL